MSRGLGAKTKVRRAEEELAVRMGRWRENPLLFVLEMWDFDPFKFPDGRDGRHERRLDRWQEKILKLLLINPRIALAACKGPGKSTELAWIGWWLLFCHIDASGACMSVTKDNLRDNLWKELALWYSHSELLQHYFTVGKTRIESRARPDTWFLSARSIPADANQQDLSSSLAGLHSAVVFVLLDEIGDMPPGVIGAAHGIFTVAGQRGWVIGAGNRTSRRGALYYIESEEAESWHIETITGDPDDPDRSTRISMENARREIAEKGRDHPWVMVNILGLYPPASSQQRIDLNKVEEAMRRRVAPISYQRDAIIWGIDPAYSDRAGADEATLARRQGAVMRPILSWRGLDGPALAMEITQQLHKANLEKKYPHRIFVDRGGVGTSCYDHLLLLGYNDIVIGVDFGGRADDHERFFDKRTEIWDRMANWVEGQTSCLPKDPVLRKELIAPESGPATKGGRTVFKLESKADMKKRGVRSPNRGDALALTFTSPVITPALQVEQELMAKLGIHQGSAMKVKTEYSLYGG